MKKVMIFATALMLLTLVGISYGVYDYQVIMNPWTGKLDYITYNTTHVDCTNITGGTDTDFCVDAGGTELDPYWTANQTDVAFTNIAETFDENLVCAKNLTVDTDTLVVEANSDLVGINKIPTDPWGLGSGLEVEQFLTVSGVACDNGTIYLGDSGDPTQSAIRMSFDTCGSIMWFEPVYANGATFIFGTQDQRWLTFDTTDNETYFVGDVHTDSEFQGTLDCDWMTDNTSDLCSLTDTNVDNGTYEYEDWDTAFGWGDHGSGGYAPADSPTFTTAFTAAGLVGDEDLQSEDFGDFTCAGEDACLLDADVCDDTATANDITINSTKWINTTGGVAVGSGQRICLDGEDVCTHYIWYNGTASVWV